jgi:hypothetical protein
MDVATTSYFGAGRIMADCGTLVPRCLGTSVKMQTMAIQSIIMPVFSIRI